MAVLSGFFTGLSINEGTRPGFTADNEKFSICFEGIDCLGVGHEVAVDVKRKFESSYDWTAVAELVLACLEGYYDDYDFLDDVNIELKEWLSEFEGWGLCFTLFPTDFQQFFLVLFSLINVKCEEEGEGMTNEEKFVRIKSMYMEETQGLPMTDLIPRVEAKMMEIVGGLKEDKRRKMLKIHFHGPKYRLVTKFSVFKRRLRRNLVEIAAEVVAQNIADSDDLEIPEILKEVVSEKLIDEDWISSYLIAKTNQCSPANSREGSPEAKVGYHISCAVILSLLFLFSGCWSTGSCGGETGGAYDQVFSVRSIQSIEESRWECGDLYLFGFLEMNNRLGLFNLDIFE